MSFKALNWALDDRALDDSSARHILLILANYANEFGIAYPTVETLAAGSGMHRRTVFRNLQKLRDSERIFIIERKTKRGTQLSSLYVLNIREDFASLVDWCVSDPDGTLAAIAQLYVPGVKMSPGKKTPPGDIQDANRVTSDTKKPGGNMSPVEPNKKDLNQDLKPNSAADVEATPEPPSDIPRLMKIHADRIGKIPDRDAQAGILKKLLNDYPAADLAGCYQYQVTQLRSETGGWRESVSWKTVSTGVAEWIVAGRPVYWKDVRGKPKAVDTFGNAGAGVPIGPDDFGGEDFPAADFCDGLCSPDEICMKLHRSDMPASNAAGGDVVEGITPENLVN